MKLRTEHRRPRGRPQLLWSWLGLLLLAAPAALARVKVVAPPARDSVQLTTYNSADRTLVKAQQVSGGGATSLLYVGCLLRSHGLLLFLVRAVGFGLLLCRLLSDCLRGFVAHNRLSFAYKFTRLRKDSFLLRQWHRSLSCPARQTDVGRNLLRLATRLAFHVTLA